MKFKIAGEQIQEMAAEASYRAGIRKLLAAVPKARAIVEEAKKAKEDKVIYVTCDKCGIAFRSCDGNGWEIGLECPSGLCFKFIKKDRGHLRVMTQEEKTEFLAKVKENGAMCFNEKGECLFHPAHKNNSQRRAARPDPLVQAINAVGGKAKAVAILRAAEMNA